MTPSLQSKEMPTLRKLRQGSPPSCADPSQSASDESPFGRMFASAFVASAVSGLCSLATIVILGWRGTTGQVGDWTLALAITAPSYVLVYCRLRSVVSTDVRGEHTWSQYFAHRIVGSVIASTISISVAGAFYGRRTAEIVAVMAVGRFGDAVSDLVYGLDFRTGSASRAAKSSVNRSVAGLAVFCVSFIFTDSVWMSVALQAPVLVIGAVLDIYWGVAPTGTRWQPIFHPKDLIMLARQVLPLGIAGAIATLQLSAPRYVLAADRSRSELGVFGLLSSGLMIGNLVIGAAAQAVAPHLAELRAQQRWVEFRRLLGRLIALGATLAFLSVAFCVLAGRPLVGWAFGPVVASHTDALVWLSVAFGLLWMYVYLGTALDALRYFSAQPWIQGLSAAGTIVASVVLIPDHGLVGASWALLLGFSIECIGYLLAVRVAIHGHARKPL